MPSGRRILLESELGNLQAFGAKDRDLNTIERALNQRKKVEIEEIKVGIRPVTSIYIDDVFFIKIEGY